VFEHFGSVVDFGRDVLAGATPGMLPLEGSRLLYPALAVYSALPHIVLRLVKFVIGFLSL